MMTAMNESDVAELSSLANTLDEAARRLEAIARRYEDTDEDDVAARLRDAERSLTTALRRVESIVRSAR